MGIVFYEVVNTVVGEGYEAHILYSNGAESAKMLLIEGRSKREAERVARKYFGLTGKHIDVIFD